MQSQCDTDPNCAWYKSQGSIFTVPQPAAICVPRRACGGPGSGGTDFSAVVLVGMPAADPVPKNFPVVLDGLAAPDAQSIAACFQAGGGGGAAAAGMSTPAPAVCVNLPCAADAYQSTPAPCACTAARVTPGGAALRAGDNLNFMASDSLSAYQLRVQQIYADWECSTNATPPYNAPCQRVPLNISQCPVPSAQRQYILEMSTPHNQLGQPATVSLRCIPAAQKAAIFGTETARSAFASNVFTPLSPETAPVCMDRLLPPPQVDCSDTKQASTAPCKQQASASAECATLLQDFNRLATTKNAQAGLQAGAAVTPVNSPLFLNRVGQFAGSTTKTSSSSPSVLTRSLQTLPRAHITQVVYEDSQGLPQYTGETQVLTPTAWDGAYVSLMNQDATIPVRLSGDRILRNMSCLSNNPDRSSASCTAYTLEGAPQGASTGVYLQAPLECTPPPSSGGGSSSPPPTNADLIQRAGAKLQDGYRQCMAHFQCSRSVQACNSQYPTDPTWCPGLSETQCTQDSTCLWSAQHSTCAPLCAGKSEIECAGVDTAGCNQFSALQNGGVLQNTQCLAHMNGCPYMKTKEACLSHGTAGLCTWSKALGCYPTDAVCSQGTGAQSNDCVPTQPQCAWDRATGQCRPGCLSNPSGMYSNSSTGQLILMSCAANQLLEGSMTDRVTYAVSKPPNDVTSIDATIATWQNEALTQDPWRTFQYGPDSLVSTLASGDMLPPEYYTPYSQHFCPQTEAPGSVAYYLPQTLGRSAAQDGSGATQTACDAFQVTQTCNSIQYECMDTRNIPTRAPQTGLNLGSVQSKATHTSYVSSVDMRPVLEGTAARSAGTLANTMESPPWGCAQMPLCAECCNPDDVQPCCQRGQCCPRLTCAPASGAGACP